MYLLPAKESVRISGELSFTFSLQNFALFYFRHGLSGAYSGMKYGLVFLGFQCYPWARKNIDELGFMFLLCRV